MAPIVPLAGRAARLLDYFYLEFGINDPGVTGGTGQFSMQKELDMLLRVKADGANFGLAGATADEPGKELAFAFAMLATDGKDFLGDDTQYPDNPVTWYHGTNLGAPLSSYYLTSQGVYERDFQYGAVIVNPPVARGGSYTLTCNYGAVVNTILAYSGGDAFSTGDRCTYQSFFGNTAQFTCQVPAVGRRTLTNTCSLVAGGNLNTCPLTNPLPSVVVTAPASHDFNGDSKSDIALRDGNGDVAFWLMSASAVLSSGGVGGIRSTWSIVGQRDFNGDGMADLLWRDTSGNLAMWFMNGTSVSSTASVGNIPINWSVVGVADFNGDGIGDLLWGDSSGDLAVWLMNEATVMSSAGLGNVPTSWTVAGIGDFNGDGMADILWRDNLGNTSIWFMNGMTLAATAPVGNIPAFNGDNLGNTSIGLMKGAAIIAIGGLGNVSTKWSVAQTGDYNGDGLSDLLWRDNLGNTSMWFMNGTAVAATPGVGNIPTTWTVQSVNAE
jgi:hypothetical protein